MKNKYALKIKEARQRLNLSQAKLAKLVNVSQQTIASWEVARTEPKSENYKSLSEALNVPISYFIDDHLTYMHLTFNNLYEELDETDKEKTMNYMKLLNKQEKERQAFE